MGKIFFFPIRSSSCFYDFIMHNIRTIFYPHVSSEQFYINIILPKSKMFIRFDSKPTHSISS